MDEDRRFCDRRNVCGPLHAAVEVPGTQKQRRALGDLPEDALSRHESLAQEDSHALVHFLLHLHFTDWSFGHRRALQVVDAIQRCLLHGDAHVVGALHDADGLFDPHR